MINQSLRYKDASGLEVMKLMHRTCLFPLSKSQKHVGKATSLKMILLSDVALGSIAPPRRDQTC